MALHTARAAVLTGYDSDLYRELYGGWHRAEIATATGQARVRNRRTEGVWSNRPLGTALCLFEDDLQAADTEDSPAARTG